MLMEVGEEIQKLSVVQSLPSLLVEDAKGCMQKLFPKINQGLIQGCTEYHLTASAAVRAIVTKKLIPPDQIVQNFLHTVLSCIDCRDAEVSRAWFETMLDVITILPFSIIHREILPTAIAKSEMSKPILQRLMSCRLLGRIAHCCDAYVLKKDVFPLIQALTQDTSKEVRAAICMELPACASILTSSIDKDILPILNEFANDEECIVKVAACQTMVDVLPYLSPDVLKNVIIPLSKKMIDSALFPGEDEMKVIVTKNFGKLCLGFEKVMSPIDKNWMLEHFSKLAQLGLPQMKFKDRVVLKQMQSRSPHTSSMYLECRLNCAYNIPALLLFSSDLDNSCISNTIYPVICDLASDPYFMVRRSVGAGIHEVTRILGHDNSLVIMEFIKLLKDDAEEVLQGVVPNLKDTMESFCETKTLTPDFVDETAIELARALIKCESEIASTYDWRLHSTFLEQLEVLPKCLPSDFIYNQFVPIIFKRLFSCRAVPCRLAIVRTLLIFLRYNLKPSQRAEMRNKLINELCCSPNFYDRIIYVRSCPSIMDIFSSLYFREFFFARTMQLMEDKTPNIRLLAYALLPQLKLIARSADRSTPKFTQMVDSALKISVSEKDRDVIDCIVNVTQKIEKMNLTAFKPDPKDIQKQEEEKHLSTLTGGKEWKSQLPSAPLGATGVTGPGSRITGGLGGGGSTSALGGLSEKRGPLSSQVTRVDGGVRSSSAPPATGDQGRFRSVASAGTPGLAIRSPNTSVQSFSGTASKPTPPVSRFSSDLTQHSVSVPLLPSCSNNNNNNNDLNDDSNDSNNNQKKDAKNDSVVVVQPSQHVSSHDTDSVNSRSTDISNKIIGANSVMTSVEGSFRIPVRRVHCSKFYQSVSSKNRRHSSFCDTGIATDEKLQSDFKASGKIDLRDPKNGDSKNSLCDNSDKRNTFRRPHSMTALLSSSTSITQPTQRNNSRNVSANHVSRLPIRSTNIRLPPPKRN